ncbi:cutinase family protein [Mycobacterium sp. ACS4331]|uniref:cutinase family protein n=1 Tax=Mycobacterium sp. ACS4331 TaxID=1834121 RepID=UPI001E3C4BC9|nr:cutinase family protein [Mycobacterium sp. ACS4331]
MTALVGFIPRLLVAVILLSLPLAVAPTTTAEPCPDIGVAFARGTAEQPGPGVAGQRFIDSLRAQAAPRTVGVYGVNYPASSDFASGPAFTMNVVDGVRDELNHVRGVVSVCPSTEMVLGGYSQGAAVTALATSGAVPAGVDPSMVPAPLPPDVAENVAAVVLFGKPSGPSVFKYGVPALDVGPAYAGRAQELCAPGDPVCSGGPGVNGAHVQYAVNGLADQGAAFVVSRLEPIPAPM